MYWSARGPITEARGQCTDMWFSVCAQTWMHRDVHCDKDGSSFSPDWGPVVSWCGSGGGGGWHGVGRGTQSLTGNRLGECFHWIMTGLCVRSLTDKDVTDTLTDMITLNKWRRSLSPRWPRPIGVRWSFQNDVHEVRPEVLLSSSDCGQDDLTIMI